MPLPIIGGEIYFFYTPEIYTDVHNPRSGDLMMPLFAATRIREFIFGQFLKEMGLCVT